MMLWMAVLAPWIGWPLAAFGPSQTLLARTRNLGKAVVFGKSLRRQTPRRAARNLPLPDIGFGAGPFALAAHLPAQPLGQSEGPRIRQPAIAVALKGDPLPAAHHRHFLEVENDQFAVEIGR